jgi:GTP cyclohydrolase I
MLRPEPMNDMTHFSSAGLLQIPDTQSARDERHLAIQRVGVKQLRYPLTVSVQGVEVVTVASWSLDVALPAARTCRVSSRDWTH